MNIGRGSHVYEIATEWGKLPEGIEYGYTHGIVVDASDRVYVHNRSKDAVIVFDREGHFIKSWGEEFAEGAHGMCLSKEGDQEYLYFADPARHIVVKTTLEGEKIFTLGVPDLPSVYDTEEKYKPTDVAVAPNGDIYVSDGYGQSWIHQYNRDGEWIRSWGGKVLRLVNWIARMESGSILAETNLIYMWQTERITGFKFLRSKVST